MAKQWRAAGGATRWVAVMLAVGLPLLAQAQATSQTSSTWRERWQQRRAESHAASTTATINGPGDYALSMDHAGLQRLYRVHVPASYRADKAVPLVLVLHGGGGDAEIQANDAFYGQISKSDAEGYVVAFPNGFSRFKSGKLGTWNAGLCCGAARDQGVDDVGFLRALVQHLRSQLNIDAGRVFADGMSNGGMMAYRLACEAGDVFKAVASVAGTDNTRSCSPGRPLSILHIHAKDDDMVLFNGGAGRLREQVNDFVSVPETTRRWVQRNGCATTPRRVLEVAGATCDVYAPCSGGTEVKLCITDTGGHSWPGGTKPRGGASGSTALSATDEIWAFFNSR